ncbi:hypothetical protein, partial [Microcoleus sp. herbarium5]|uniref:hypothetical protein n=1 Tax=Microcoleus sp. herbarium5 TaxID=3055434 RepID=UPI002FD2C94D
LTVDSILLFRCNGKRYQLTHSVKQILGDSIAAKAVGRTSSNLSASAGGVSVISAKDRVNCRSNN